MAHLTVPRAPRSRWARLGKALTALGVLSAGGAVAGWSLEAQREQALR